MEKEVLPPSLTSQLCAKSPITSLGLLGSYIRSWLNLGPEGNRVVVELAP